MVTVIIPAFNEESTLEAKIRNTLASDYPALLLDVIVVSDASTDRTNEIARSFAAAGVTLIVQEQRVGKTAGLNRAVSAARGEILVFTDANAMYERTTIARLVEHLGTARTGLVTGYTRYRMRAGNEVAKLTNVYTSLERVIKRAETRWGCCVGADGAVFAMWRHLYRPLRADDINDFVLPLSVIEQGYACVLVEDAYCTERAGNTLESEFRRQSRITNRTLRAIARRSHLLNPLRFPAFAFCLWSHKLIRFLVPMFLVISTASLALLALSGGVSAVALVSSLFLVIAAFVFRRVVGRSGFIRALHLLEGFITMNIAVLAGWWNFLNGRADVTWQHDRTARTAVAEP